MAQEDISEVSSVQKAIVTARAEEATIAQSCCAELADESLEEWSELAAFNPLALTKRFQTLEERIGRKVAGEKIGKAEKEEEEGKILQVEKVEESAEAYQRKNPELNKHVLLLLKSRIAEGDSKEEIAKKVLDLFPDPYLADEALDFLLETTEGDVADTIRSVKEDLTLLYGREIRSGKNMGAISRKYALQGIGDPKTLRNLYREVTGNPKEPLVLFDEFSSHFDFDRLQPLIGFLLHSLGSDLKSKGPSISRAELQRLFSETRTMQAILGVYRYFKGRMGAIKRIFSLRGFLLPSALTFELLSKLYVKLLQERYPNTAKLLQFASMLGLSEEIAAQIIIYSQMKEGLRHTSPKLFRNEKHRHDLMSVFLDALEELEDALEEEEEEEDEEKEEKKKEKK